MTYFINSMVESYASWLFGSSPSREDAFQEMPIMGADELSLFYSIATHEIPPIPHDLRTAWETELCPFWSGKHVKETHLLLLVPKHETKGPINLQSILTQAQEKFPGSNQCLKPFVNNEVDLALSSCTPHDQAYWVLVTKKHIPNTFRLTLDEQQKMIREQTSRKYGVVSMMEATLAILAAASQNVPLFSPELKT